jgi:hypothetical protein
MESLCAPREAILARGHAELPSGLPGVRIFAFLTLVSSPKRQISKELSPSGLFLFTNWYNRFVFNNESALTILLY